MTRPRLLVVRNDPTDDARRLGAWLADAGADLVHLAADAGDPLPDTLDGFDGLVVLGGAQDAWDAADGTPGAPWFPKLKNLLREAVRARVATLGVCLGGQLLAVALGGRVQRSPGGLRCGPSLVAKRDAADRDPLFAGVPFTPDVYSWHVDEVTALPAGAVLLAASARVPHEAFRIGDRAWGLQFHIECDEPMLRLWAEHDAPLLAGLGLDPVDVLERCAAVEDDVEDVWRPFTERFVALAAGRQGSMPLPVVDA